MFSRAVSNKAFSVYLFGSRARGEEENGSDADFAIVVEQINRADFPSFVNNGNTLLFPLCWISWIQKILGMH